MPDSPAIKAKVLFVDDDMSFLQMVRDVFGEASGGAWDIQTATSGGDALLRLRRAKMDIAVIDVFMPVMDGLQLLRMLNEEFSSVPKVLLTGMPDGNTRAAALEGGAALFLEKPANAAGYASVFATLNELMRWHQRFSAQGALRQLTILDLVRLECKSGNSRIFEVFIGEMRGEIFVKEGDIIHATMPDRRGQSAFTYLTTTPGSVFYLRQYVEPIERSVTRQWEFLVMEATQIAEQVAQSAITSSPENVVPPTAPAPPAPPAPAPRLKKAPPQPAPAATPAPPTPEPVAAPVAAIPVPVPASPASTIVPVIPVPPRVAATEPPPPLQLETPTDTGWTIPDSPDSRLMEFEPAPAGLKVEEILLCSEFRDVLYESHCPDTQKRLHLGDGILQKANELSRSLPLGELDRAELQAAGSRLVLRFESKRCLFVRTNTKARPSSVEPSATEFPQDWLDRQTLTRGLLAASILTTDGRIQQRSFVRDFSADVMQSVGRESSRLLDIAARFMFPAWQIRLIYTRTQVYAIKRQDGAVLCVFLLREGNDTVGMQCFFEEFKQVRGA